MGDAATTTVACDAPANYVADATDCDDTNAGLPGALGQCVAPYTTAFGSERMAVPAGTFTMGGGLGDPDGAYTDHGVTLTHAFWLGKSEVTQAALFAGIGTSPSSFTGDDLPVEQVSPYTCPGYRLPTEAEWEYADSPKTRGVCAT